MVVPQIEGIEGPQRRPLSTIILIMGTPNRVPQVLVNPQSALLKRRLVRIYASLDRTARQHWAASGSGTLKHKTATLRQNYENTPTGASYSKASIGLLYRLTRQQLERELSQALRQLTHGERRLDGVKMRMQIRPWFLHGQPYPEWEWWPSTSPIS